MKVVVLYRPVSEHARAVDEFSHEFVRRYPELHIELQNIDTRDGWSTASLYDVTQYPAVMTVGGDGSATSVWQGQPLPMLDEVAGYALI